MRNVFALVFVTASTACHNDAPASSAVDAGSPLRRDAGAIARPADTGVSGPSPPTSPRANEHPVIFAYRAALAARSDGALRQQLESVDTTGTATATRPALEWLAADRAVRTFSVMAFEGAGDATAVADLRRVAQVTNRTSCDRAMDVLTTVAGRARTSVARGQELAGRLLAATRAAGDAGNACRDAVSARTTDDASDVCDDVHGIGVEACRAAASASGARAGGAAARAIEASSGASASREAAVILLRDLVRAARPR